LFVNVRAIVTSLPLLRRAWRLLPGPFRIPVLVIGAGVYLWRRMTGRDVPADEQAGTSGSNVPAR
jgi:hypothetical protein